jgi:hypothetical protein
LEVQKGSRVRIANRVLNPRIGGIELFFAILVDLFIILESQGPLYYPCLFFNYLSICKSFSPFFYQFKFQTIQDLSAEQLIKYWSLALQFIEEMLPLCPYNVVISN